MAEPKTKKTNASVKDFIANVKPEEKRKDCEKLLEIFTRVTKEKPAMWGEAIVGFGQFHYKSERSKQEGDWPLTGFSPRKANLSLYILSWPNKSQDLLKKLGKLGKHKAGGGCLYINTLSDIELKILEEIIIDCVKEKREKYGI